MSSDDNKSLSNAESMQRFVVPQLPQRLRVVHSALLLHKPKRDSIDTATIDLSDNGGSRGNADRILNVELPRLSATL